MEASDTILRVDLTVVMVAAVVDGLLLRVADCDVSELQVKWRRHRAVSYGRQVH
jgi:hypothetical protein